LVKIFLILISLIKSSYKHCTLWSVWYHAETRNVFYDVSLQKGEFRKWCRICCWVRIHCSTGQQPWANCLLTLDPQSSQLQETEAQKIIFW